MKILSLPHYLLPEENAPATRRHEHCRRWVELGYEVTVVSYVPHQRMGKGYPGYRNKPTQAESKSGIKAVNVLTHVTTNSRIMPVTYAPYRHSATHGGHSVDQTLLADRYRPLVRAAAMIANTGNSAQTPHNYHR